MAIKGLVEIADHMLTIGWVKEEMIKMKK